MSDFVQNALIVTVGIVVVKYLDYRQATKMNKKLDVVVEKVEVVHKATNSLVTQLVDTTRNDALQTGAATERAKQEQKGSVP